MKTLAAVPFVLLGFGSPVLAQSAQDGFYTNGYAEMSVFNNGSGSDVLGYSEATLGYSDAGSGFGVELGVDGLISEGEDASAIYGAATYQSSFGKLSFGVPRAAIDAFLAKVPTPAGAVALKIGQIGIYKRSYVSAAYLIGGGGTPVGLRYDGSFGAANVGASYHSFENLDVFNLAANYAIGETTLTGAVEVVAANGSDDTRYFLGVESEVGPVTAGLLYTGNAFLSSGTALEAYAKYKPVGQLELAATALRIDTGSDTTTIYGATADYTFNKGLYVQGGVADSFEASSDTLYNLALGLRF